MAKRPKKKEASIYKSIRKPTAPPSQKMGKDKPEEKADPAGRKVKHKGKLRPDENNGNI